LEKEEQIRPSLLLFPELSLLGMETAVQSLGKSYTIVSEEITLREQKQQRKGRSERENSKGGKRRKKNDCKGQLQRENCPPMKREES